MAGLWARVLGAGLVACALAGTSPAMAAQTVEGETARFQWAPASGPVAGYAVYVNRNGAGFPPIPEVLTPANVTTATLSGSYGDTLVVRVAAFDARMSQGPYSSPSDAVQLTRPPVTEDELASLLADLGKALRTGGLGGGHPAEMLWVDPSRGTFTRWSLRDGVPVSQETLPILIGPWEALAACDLDGDGIQEMIFDPGDGRGEIVMSYADGSFLGLSRLAPEYLREMALVGAGDLDGDGVCELLTWREPVPGTDLVRNGSFESGTSLGSFKSLSAGANAIEGWEIGGGGVDYIGSYWHAADGGRSLDLSKASPGSVRQTLQTVPGQQYEVRFALAGNPDGEQGEKRVRVTAGATSRDFSFLTNRRSRTSMGWAPHTMRFVATSTATTLELRAIAPSSGWGPALDDVSVVAVGGPTDGYRLWHVANGGLLPAGALGPEADAPGWEVTAIADLNGDGRDDLVWTEPASGAAEAWLMAGSQPTAVVALGTVPSGFRLAATAPVGAGAQLLWHRPGDGRYELWHVGAAGRTGVTPLAVASGLSPAGHGDLDGDGAHELVWSDAGGGPAQAWRVHADGTRTVRVLPNASPTAELLLAE